MRKTFWLVNILVVLSFIMVAPVYAQGTTTTAPGTWVSSINIQNTGSGAATVTLSFYNSDGTKVLDFVITPTIPAGGSRSIYVPTDVTGLSGSQFSVVASSDQSIQVVTNLSSTGPATAGAYNGIQSDQTGKTLSFPGLYKGYFGFSSEIALQNTEATAATITISFFKPSDGSKITAATVTGSIPANSTRIYSLASLTGVPSGNSSGLVSAQVVSDKNLAGIANIWSSALHGEYADYNAYVSGSTTTLFAPALYKNYFNFVSSLTVQNIGSTSGRIRVTYSNGTAEADATLQPFQSIQYYQPSNAALPSGNAAGVFSAKVESLDSQPIVAMVNVEDKTKGLFASYNAPSSVTNSAGCPVVMQSYYGWFSAETVQNVGTAPTNITMTYASGQSRTINNVPANGTVNFIEMASNGSPLPNVSSVSGTITTSGQPVVAVVQENSNSKYTTTPGDYLLAYTCVAK